MRATRAVGGDQDASVAPARVTAFQRLRHFKDQPSALIAAFVFVMLVFAGSFAGLVTPFEPTQIVSAPLQGPSAEFWFGTDEIGRDLYTRMVYGARTSISIGLMASVIALVIGVPWGLASGYYGKLTDTISMRLTDALLAFPGIILAMATVAVLGPSATNVMIAIGIIQIPRFTRLVRAETLVYKEREFVSAAQAAGATDLYIMRKAIFPNLTSTLIVQFTLTFALAVLTEAGLSFIGLGVRPPNPTWGAMLNTAKNYVTQRSGYMLLTGSAVFILVLSLSMIGDALRDALDPDRVQRGSGSGSGSIDEVRTT